MAIEYIPYFPTTTEGQALLNNFTRTQRILRYRDNDRIVSSVERGMPLFDTTLEETVGCANSGNLVLRGECLSACAYLKKKINSGEMKPIDLVYIDPTFASGADYAKQVFIRRNPNLASQIADAQTRLEDEALRSFEEKMYGDIWDKERYLNWMYENLRAIKSVMSSTGSIYVHLDYHIGPYVKVLLDEIFGEDSFQNEIIWKRSTAHSDSGGFANLHDSIYYYAWGQDFTFNTQYVPYSEEYIERYYRHSDANGRRYLDRDLSAKGLSGGGYTYDWNGKPGYWRCPIETMRQYESEDRLYYTSNGTPRYKQYLDEMPGVPAQDLWTDIYAVNSQAQERVDYATQKPESLLSRIIAASSNEGMLVADFFGGSGVTAAVSAKTGRNFIHCDVGINSIQTVRQRLKQDGASFDIFEIRDGVSLYRNPVQTMDKIKSLVPGLCNEDGLDKFWEGAMRTATDGMIPVYIPNLTDSTTKLLDKPLVLRIINEAMPDLPATTKKVIVFYVDIDNIKEIEHFIADQNDTNIQIELRDLKPLLTGTVVEDSFSYEIDNDTSDSLSNYRVRILSFSSDRLEGKIEEFNEKGIFSGKKSFVPISISESGIELIELVSVDCSSADGVWHADAEIYIDKLGYVVKDGQRTESLWDGTICCEEKPLRIKVRNISGDETVVEVGA